MNKRLKKKKGLLISDDDIWDLDYNLAKYILPRLKRFKTLQNKYTQIISNEDLDKMILSFEYITGSRSYVGYYNSESYKNKPFNELDDVIQEGLEIFSNKFTKLWL